MQLRDLEAMFQVMGFVSGLQPSADLYGAAATVDPHVGGSRSVSVKRMARIEVLRTFHSEKVSRNWQGLLNRRSSS